MDDGFEALARAEVLRLRRKADELEAWLARYAEGAAQGPEAPASLAQGPQAARVEVVARPSHKGRNAPLMKAIEAAGATGLSVEEVQQAAYRAGLTPNRATVRSYLWNQRQAGRVVALEDGRHVVAAYAPGAAAAAAPASGGDARPEDGRD